MSRYFNESEMICHCCGCLPDTGINGVLVDKLDALRDYVGEPIHVTCMYRCARHNAEVGGVWNSQHVLGNAADIYCDGIGVDELAAAALAVGFDAVGRYYNSGFVHVDVRSNGTEPGVYQWNG